MAKSKQERYETNRESLKRYAEEGQISTTERDLIIEFLDANDPNRHMFQMPDGKTKAPGTLARYARNIGRVARDLEPDLTEITAKQINQLMQGYLTGEVESAKDEGLTKGSVSKTQGPMRRFYLYHDELGIEPEDIIISKPDNKTVDPRDIFDSEDIQALREAAKNRGARDACIVDLLLYTGQRRSAILNLRLKDVKPDEGVFFLNEEEGDLKGASGKRPLLGAQKAARDWKRQHPTGVPEDFLITHKVDQSYREDNDDLEAVKSGDKLNPTTIYTTLQKIGNEAEVDKPCNSHNFRHAFVTHAIKEYDMSPDTVKHLIGHKPGSTVLESTYSHLTDEDYIEKAEEATGIREPEQNSPLTPSVCDRCSEPLDGDFRVCPYCGYTYSPDAAKTKEQIDETMWEGKSEAEPGTEVSEGVDELRKLLKENPEAVEQLLDDS